MVDWDKVALLDAVPCDDTDAVGLEAGPVEVEVDAAPEVELDPESSAASAWTVMEAAPEPVDVLPDVDERLAVEDDMEVDEV